MSASPLKPILVRPRTTDRRLFTERREAKSSWPRFLLFVLFLFASLLIFRTPLKTLLSYPLWGDNQYDKYSCALAVPLLSGALIFVQRDRVFSRVNYSPVPALALAVAGTISMTLTNRLAVQLGPDKDLSLGLLGLILFWLGAFAFCFGIDAFRRARFPLLFLLLSVPLPDFLLSGPIAFVQYGSAAVCSFFFSLFGVPVLREGLIFTLPAVTIRIATECSGIHSTLAVLIISLIAGELYLPAVWKRILLVCCALPIVCLTNGLRIAVLTLLAEFGKPGFLHGSLHHRGGIVFFLLALGILSAILRTLSSWERATGTASRFALAKRRG